MGELTIKDKTADPAKMDQQDAEDRIKSELKKQVKVLRDQFGDAMITEVLKEEQFPEIISEATITPTNTWEPLIVQSALAMASAYSSEDDPVKKQDILVSINLLAVAAGVSTNQAMRLVNAAKNIRTF